MPLIVAERAMAIARRFPEPFLLVAALSGVGTTSFFAGDLVRSRKLLEQVASRSDAKATAARSREAVQNALDFGHPFSLGNARAFASIVHIGRHEMDEVRAKAAAMRLVSTEHGLTLIVNCGTILEGWVLVQQGKMQHGLAQIREGIAAHESTAGPLIVPWFHGLLAEALGRAGEVETALETLDRALAAVERSGERWFEAELYRLGEEMSLRSGPRQARRRGRSRTPESAAEVCFWSAIEVARRQAAKSWELRAATSLGRLRQQQERVQEARKALADVYGWFTEGLDTPDLLPARSLLAELT
jgi:predicted ATPase